MPTTIGKLSAILTLNSSKFTKGIGNATRGLTGFANNVAGAVGRVAAFGGAVAGVAGAGSLGFMLRSTLDNVDATTKFADRLGIATERLSGLHHAAELSGVSTQNLNLGLQRMTRRVAEAAGGTGEAVNALRELGLDAEALAAMSPDRQFSAIADAMEAVGGQSDRVRLAFKLFDSEGVALLNTLKGGSAELERTIREADKLGLTFNRIEAAKIEEANDAITRAKGAVQGLVTSLTVALSPAIQAVADKFQVVTDAIRDVASQWDVFKAAAELSLLQTALAVSEFSDGIVNSAINIGKVFGKAFENIATIGRNLFSGSVLLGILDNFLEYWKRIFMNAWTITKNLASNITSLFKAAFEAIRTGSLEPLSNLTFKSLTEGTKNITEPVLDAVEALTKGTDLNFDFRGLTEDSPITSALKTAVEQAQKDLTDAINRGSQVSGGGDPTGTGGGDATATGAAGGPRFAGALVRGSAAEFSARLAAIGGGANDPAKKTEKNTEETADNTGALVDLFRRFQLNQTQGVQVVSI